MGDGRGSRVPKTMAGEGGNEGALLKRPEQIEIIVKGKP